MASFVGIWVLLAGAYVLFTGQLDPVELTAAGVVALAAAVWALALRRAAHVGFAWRAQAFAPAKICLALPRNIAQVGGILMVAALGLTPRARVPGAILAEPFEPGRREDPAAAARRAVTVLARSLAPDSYVLRLPLDGDRIEMHDLGGGASPSGAGGAR